MSSACQCSTGCGLFSDWVVPEGILQRKLGKFYANHPVMSRVLATPIATICGIAKVVLFPMICLIGMIAMPIIAIIRAGIGKKDGGEWVKAWCFSILGVAGCIAFFGFSTYYLPLISTSAFLVGGISLSIIVHVYKFVKEPPPQI